MEYSINTIEDLILFKTISGSHAYGLNTDVDELLK